VPTARLDDHVDPTMGLVVGEGIVEEVGDQPFNEPSVACRDRWGEPLMKIDASSLRLVPPREQHFARHACHVERLSGPKTRLSAG
jgi:hypothetical protein